MKRVPLYKFNLGTIAVLLWLGIRYDIRHALYLVVKALRVVAFAAYTRAVAWELRLGPDEVEYGE